MSTVRIGVIGGSGLYQIDGLEFLREEKVDTPFGDASDVFKVFSMSTDAGVVEVVFLPRHGRNHHVNPSEVNYRANIFGMKVLGVQWIISVSAVGSLQEHIAPGQVVLVDQYIDRTTKRQNTFFQDGVAAHVPFGEPICEQLRGFLKQTCDVQKHVYHDRGTYVNMEGPAFSTRAESEMHRSWGASVIGMTSLTEARLAREAEIAYACLAMVTDYDCWRGDHDSVNVEEVVRTMKTNVLVAKEIIRGTIPRITAYKGAHPLEHALKGAVMTATDAIPDRLRHDLAPILGKYIGVPSNYVYEEVAHKSHQFGKPQKQGGCGSSSGTWLHAAVAVGLVVGILVLKHVHYCKH